ncbi:MAG: HAD family hydrolase [Oscillospiraceae bacterium]|nr:HAD family hydrolase [Oscillospiraceae bacterium]
MAQFFNFEEDYFGLTDSEIQKKIDLYGLNTYTKESKDDRFSYWQVLLSPAVLLMFAAAILSFFSGAIGSGIAALLIDAAYAGAEIYARRSSDQRLCEIEDTTVTKFRVIRSGKLELVEKDNIVPEDTIVVQAGERVPADAFILESRDLTADESIFTGDRTPAAKYVGGMSKSDLKPTFVYSGTTVLTGIAVCKVSATGVDTRLHQVEGDVKDRHPYYTSLERIVRGFVPIAGCVAALLTLASMIIRLVFSDNSAIESALNAVTVGLCFVPAGLGTVIRLFYTKGAMELLKNGAVVKSFADIEKLNSLSVLCIEKEGAISKSHLEVRGIYARSEELLYKVAALACEPNHNDAAVSALMVKATFFDEKIKDVYSENTFIEKLPESGDTLSGAIWEVGGERLCCIKGVPEQILPMCRLNGDALFAAKKKYEDYYAKGCSVLAVACVDAENEAEDVTAGFSYTFVGFAAFSSPLRDSVSTAVKTCRRSGVRVVMLTEDNPSVAVSTGKMIGISGGEVVTGRNIDAAVNGGDPFDINAEIFAKITSSQKMYVIKKLKENGGIVAMTGTRSEDAAVLEASDVGITISQHTAGSTYEAADIIMNDDNFTAIANMIAKARQIHRNIKHAVSVMIAGYIGLMLLIIINLFSGTVLMPTPPVVALITMIFLPFAGLGFLSKKYDTKTIMPPSEFVANRKLNLRYIGGAALFGGLSGAVAAASYLFMYNGTNFGFARSCSLITYCFCTAAFILLRHIGDDSIKNVLSASLTAKLSVIIIAVLPILLVYIPFVNSAFGLGAIDVLALVISIISGVLPAIAYFFIKYFFKLKELS